MLKELFLLRYMVVSRMEVICIYYTQVYMGIIALGITLNGCK